MNEQIKTISNACIKANPNIVKGLDVWVKTEEGGGDEIKKVIRPIRLADVLLAIQKVNKSYAVNTEGGFELWNHHYGDEYIYQDMYITWNLTKDNLSLQSPETISFIFELL